MKIIFTATGAGLIALQTYIDTNVSDNTFAIWHNDTLSYALYQDLINTHGTPDILISSAHPEYQMTNADYYYFPDWLTIASTKLNNQITYECLTEYCFNFAINKHQVNRHLLLKLVEWFNLSSYDGTWKGLTFYDTSQILKTIDTLPVNLITDINKFVNHLKQPITQIKPKFFDIKAQAYDNVKVWNLGLGEIISKSAVSLISESVTYDKTMIFTEKTLFSIKGLTFPIWIGGYKQAELWEQHGFDTFNDVINHDYQYCDTLLERCIRAFTDNLPILTDVNFADCLRQQHMNRLKNNQNIMSDVLSKQYRAYFNRMPVVLQQNLIKMIKEFGTSQLNYRLLGLD
jgi:hypothetical protein